MKRIVVCLLVVGLLLSACAAKVPTVAPVAPVAAPQVEQPRLAILSAFDAELQVLLAKADITATEVINGRTYYIGTLQGQPVVMTLTGVSMVNASASAQAMLDHFSIRAVIFSGIAGGVSPVLHIGDVIVPAQWGQYMENLLARETPDGWNVGWHSAPFTNFGMQFPQTVSVAQQCGEPDAETEVFWFPVAPDLLAIAAQVATQVELAACTPEEVCLTDAPRIVVGGNGVSGQSFVDNAAYRDWAWSTFQADALDMETAAVAQVAYIHCVPYIAFRSLSDLAGGGPGENEIAVFFGLAADNSANYVLAFLAALP